MLIRTQVQLTDTQLDALRVHASRRRRSVADLVRESVDLYLQRASAADRTYLIERAKAVSGRFSSAGSKEPANG